MASYVDYTYYTATYLGSAISQSAFPALALRASALIDQITHGRVAAIITADDDAVKVAKIKNAVCAVAEEIQTINSAGGIDGIASESVGNHSVTYNANATNQLTSGDKKYNAAALWLSTTELLFAGFAEGEYSDDYAA